MSASHTRTVVSSLPVASQCPSGLNTTPHISSVWPVTGAPRGWPVSASHPRTVWSALALASRCPVGAEHHTGHRVGVAGDDLQGAGPLNHRVAESVVENTVVGAGEGSGGQDLLEGAHIAAGLGAGQHALGLGDQLLRGRGPQIGLGLLAGGAQKVARTGEVLPKLGGVGQGFSVAQAGAGQQPGRVVAA